MKNRLTNYNFWISLVSAVLLILQAFNFQFDIAYINEIATAVLGLLVVIGIISDPTKTAKSNETQKLDTNKEIAGKTTSKIENKSDETKPNEDVPLSNKEVSEEQKAELNLLEKELETAVPIDEQNANVADNFEINFQNLIKQISDDLNQKLGTLYSTANFKDALIPKTEGEFEVDKTPIQAVENEQVTISTTTDANNLNLAEETKQQQEFVPTEIEKESNEEAQQSNVEPQVENQEFNYGHNIVN